MTRTDPYALHRKPTVDAHLAYCRTAQSTLARLKAAKARRTLGQRIVNLFRKAHKGVHA